VLGVFTNEAIAYSCIIDKLLEDLNRKDKTIYDTTCNELDDEAGSNELMQKVTGKCVEAFGQNKEPYGWVAPSKIN